MQFYVYKLPCGVTLIVLIQNEYMYPQKNQSDELSVCHVINGTFKFFKTIYAYFFSIFFCGFKGILAAVGCRFVTNNVKLIGLSEPGKMVVQDFKIKSQRSFSVARLLLGVVLLFFFVKISYYLIY